MLVQKYADEVKEMKKQLPKNVRQIGNVSDSSKIYVEDYVDTFFSQLCDKADQAPVGAFLVGETVHEGEEDYIYVYGALRMKEPQIDEEIWKQACEQCKEYFGDAAILGWFLATKGQALEVNHNITKMHQKYFPKDKTLFIIKDAETKEEKYFIHRFRDLLECSGHYIYYEKNVEMQNYMIASRKKNGVTPSEVVEDRAAKNFRNVIKERMDTKEKKQHSRFLYAASTFLIIIAFGIGVSMVNNYEKMQNAKESIDVLSDTINNTKKEEVEEKQPEVIVPEPEKVEPEEPVTETPETTEAEEEQKEEAEGDAEVFYTVQKGDTLLSISKEQYGDSTHVEEICKANGLEDGNLIFIGQKLLLP